MDRINLTEDEALLIQIFLSILLIISLTLNVVYLFSIKSFNDRLNATEALQFSKTIIVLLTLVLYLPLEIITTSVKGCNVKNICHLKDFTEKLLMEMYPLTVLVTAITRLRVSVCLGNADILVTKTSAFITLALSIVFPLGFALGSLVLKMKSDFAVSYQVFLYDLITLMIVSILSIFASCVIYAFIFYRVKATASRLYSRQLGRSRHFGNLQHQRYKTVSVVRQRQNANVQLSIVILITVFISSWTIYVALKVMCGIFGFKVAKIALIFSKVVVYLLHPIAEGMFLAHKRNNLGYFIRKICYRTKFNKKIVSDFSSYVESTVIRNIPLCHVLSTVQDVPVCLKTRKSTRRNVLSSIGNQMSNDSLHTRRTGGILMSFQIPLNVKEECTGTKEGNIELNIPKHICFGQCPMCYQGINSPKTYYNCPIEVSTYDEKRCNKRVNLTNVYQDHSAEVAPIPELILTPHSSHNETVSKIIPRNRLQSFHAQRPFQSCEPCFRFRSFSNDSNTKNGQNRFGPSIFEFCRSTNGFSAENSNDSNGSYIKKKTGLNRNMQNTLICSKSCKQNIEMSPIGNFKNVSPVSGNQRSVFPSHEMANHEMDYKRLSTGSLISSRSEETTPSETMLLISPFPSHSTCKSHRSVNSKQSFGSSPSFARESVSTHPPGSDFSDSKSVRFKFPSIEMEEFGHLNDEETDEVFQSPRIYLEGNDVSSNLSTFMKHF